MTRLNAFPYLVAFVLFLSVVTAVTRHHHDHAAAGVPGRSTAAVRVVASAGAVPTPHGLRSRLHRRNHPTHVCGGSETSPGRLPSHEATSLVTHCLRRLDTTAYCESGSRTASGVYPKPGMAASNLFAFGQRLRVPGIGVVTVTDRIGWGSQLDVYMGGPGCEQRALTFGRRSLLVEVLP